MGTQETFQTIEEIQEKWISGHLYYHQNLDSAVQGFVHPLVVSLIKSGQIDGFFFVRYGLGGPHIRLRLRVLPGARVRTIEEMQQSAQHFLEITPSTRSMDEEVIRRSNESILKFDPNEDDSSVYPDNLFRMAPFCPEVQRYGGLNRFQTSLDFFTLSSAAAVEFLAKHGATPRPAQLAHAYRLLLQQALAFAANEVELTDLLRYGMDSWGGGPPRILEKGEKVFRSQTGEFLQLFRASLSAVRLLPAEHDSLNEVVDFLAAGARMLSVANKTADRSTRARIGGSQLHMTSTRLGLSNIEEVYISRLLILTLHEMLAMSGESFFWLEEKMAEEVEDSGEVLGHLLAPALRALTYLPTGQLQPRE